MGIFKNFKEYETFLELVQVVDLTLIDKPRAFRNDIEKLIKKLHWKKFEDFSKDFLMLKGYEAVTTGWQDNGVDIICTYNPPFIKNLQVYVQCKAVKHTITKKLIRELRGAMAENNIRFGIFMTTNEFKSPAVSCAETKPHPIHLLPIQTITNEVAHMIEIERSKAEA